MKTNYVSYLKSKSFSPLTIKNYTRYVGDMLTFVGKPEENIKYEDLIAWVETFANQKHNTQNAKISAVKNYFRYLEEFEYIFSNPAKKLTKKKVTEGYVEQKPYVEAHYVRDMVNAANNFRDKAIILLYATTGLRVSEMTGITVTQYLNMDGENNRELEVLGKGNKKRRVYIVDEVKEAIDNYITYSRPCCNSDILFVTKNGKSVARNNISSSLKRIAKEAGVPCWEKFNNHLMRSIFATSKCEQGIPLRAIQESMGHANIETTLIYVKRSQKHINDAMKKVAF